MLSVNNSVSEGHERDPKRTRDEPIGLVDSSKQDVSADGRKQEPTYVGLVRVHIPKSIRGCVENDVILEMAVQEVTETLYIYVDSCDQYESVNYVGELYNVAWDLACAIGKHGLKINVVSGATSPHAWEELLGLQELGVIFGYHQSAQSTSKWLSRHGFFPVAYRSPEPIVSTFFGPGITYFHDEDDGAVMQHTHVIVNGTFDHLHNGHRNLLSLAAGICSKCLVVGITAAQDVLNSMPFSHLIEPLSIRKQHVRDFVSSINPSIEVEFVDVVDKWGPAASWGDIRALVVISTSNIADLDAHLRQQRALTPELPMLLRRVIRRTHRSTLSSRHIRGLLASSLG